MHQTRQETSTKWPIPRKGNKYVVRAASHIDNSIPVLIAVRDMLGFAQNAAEVKQMIQQKLIKINGRPVRDYKESIKLFNILELGKKSYKLTFLPTGKFSFQEDSGNQRLCKVTNKKLLSKNQIQINLHDGSNVVTKDKITVGDSVYLDFEGKIKKHVSFEEGKKVFVIEGKHIGHSGEVKKIINGKSLVKLDNKGEAEIQNRLFIVL